MDLRLKIAAVFGAALIVSGCETSSSEPMAIKKPPAKKVEKGAALPIRDTLKKHAGQYSCADYQKSNDTCSSVSTYTISGDMVTIRETGAAKSNAGPVPLALTSRARIYDTKACISPADVSVDGANANNFQGVLQNMTRKMMANYGGVCVTYHAAKDGYLVKMTGVNGQPFPPGTQRVRFFSSKKNVRPQ